MMMHFKLTVLSCIYLCIFACLTFQKYCIYFFDICLNFEYLSKKLTLKIWHRKFEFETPVLDD